VLVRTTASSRARLSGAHKRSMMGMGLFIVALHLAGWLTLIAIALPQRHFVGGQLFGVGLGVTAYTLGMRHAFDADHIAAIDNTTRKLLSDGQRPLSVGFWFSLGHSSVVFGLCLLLSIGVRALAGQVGSDQSALAHTTGVIGAAVSGTFLMVIALLNLAVLRGIIDVVRRMRSGAYDEAELDAHLNRRGLLNRVLRGVTAAVAKPWHMYPIGVLFGLGFDTATEISLLVLAGGAAAFALPWYAVLTLPVLFAAGMSLLDTVDGSLMTFAYGWAFARPARKVYYNLTITGLSIAVAVTVGGVELTTLLADKAGIRSGPIRSIANLDLNDVGYAIGALFILTWAVALAAWRFLRIEDRWSSPSP
jgi:nickel/cobalt transporter (NiCoT) family protein